MIVSTAKHESGPYTLGQGPVTVKTKRSFYVKLVNTTPDAMHLTMKDQTFGDHPENFRVRWFRNDTNVTAAALSAGGYGFQLKPQSPKILRLELKPLVSHPGALCPGAFFTEPDTFQVYAFLYVNSSSVCG